MPARKKPKGSFRKAEPRPRPNRLKELRAKGVVLSQAQLGKLVGLDSSSVSRHESGGMAIMKDQIIAYAAVFGVPSFEIFVEPLEEEPPEEDASA